MSLNLKSMLCLVSASILIISCGKNDAEVNTTPNANAATAGTYTNYTDGVATNYQVCQDNPAQYCVNQCQAQAYSPCQQTPQTQVIRITRTIFYMPVPQDVQSRTCQGAITYGRAGSCGAGTTNGTGVLSSLRVEAPDEGVMRAEWNINTSEGVDHYRLVAHGNKDFSLGLSWVSRPIRTNFITLRRSTIGGRTSFAGTKMPTALDSLNIPLGDKVPLTEGQEYWYELVAYNADGSVFRGHLGQPITRPFDVRQTNCGGVIVSGFCDLN